MAAAVKGNNLKEKSKREEQKHYMKKAGRLETGELNRRLETERLDGELEIRELDGRLN